MATKDKTMQMTTVALTKDGKVYDLGEGEYPPQPPGERMKLDKFWVVDAFTIEVDKVNGLRKKKDRKK